MRATVSVFCCGLLLSAGGPGVLAAETKDVAKPADAPLALIAVAGAPGDGEQALIAALGKRLSAIGIKPATAFGPNVYAVEGVVKVTANKGGRDSVRIDWTVFGPDGSTMGGLSQTEGVRWGSLSRKWGRAADAAARAAAAEIAKLIPH